MYAFSACTRLGPLVGHLLGLREQRLDAAQIEQRVAAVVLLDDAGDDVALAAGVLLVLLLPVDLAETLRHHLLRPSGRRCDRSGTGVTSISSPTGSPSSSISCANTRNSNVSGSIVTHAYWYASSRRLYTDSSASASAPRACRS